MTRHLIKFYRLLLISVPFTIRASDLCLPAKTLCPETPTTITPCSLSRITLALAAFQSSGLRLSQESSEALPAPIRILIEEQAQRHETVGSLLMTIREIIASRRYKGAPLP